MKKLTWALTWAAMTFAPMTTMGDEWSDVTDTYIKNPGFSKNRTTGWDWEGWASSIKANYECMEFWDGTFWFWQDLKDLVKGHYRLSVQAFFRPGDFSKIYPIYRDGGEYDTHCLLFAADKEVEIANVFSFSFQQRKSDCWSPDRKTYYPNEMSSAAEAFKQGAYVNTLEFDAEGDTSIGLYCFEYVSSNWCIFDNFKLEYRGQLVKATSVDVKIDQASILVGQQTQCTATVLPNNAINRKVTWSSDNEAVAVVDDEGKVTGVGEGTAHITATTTDGTNLHKTVTVTVSMGSIKEGALVINEIMASNIDEFFSPAYNFDGWMELYNASDQPVSLAGLYVSDNDTNLKQWRLPLAAGVLAPKSFALVWFDSNNIWELNAPFKLDVDGGTIYISDTKGKQIATQTYPASSQRVSYARTTDGGNTWGLTDKATPGKTNNTVKYATKMLDAPVVDQPSQLFTGTLHATVNIPQGCTLRYTTDGTLPAADNGKVSTNGQFTFNETTNLRLRLFADGMLASPVTTRSYLLRDANYTLPVVSIVTDPDFLFDDMVGVYVQGYNGRPGNGQERPCNWNMDWERPVNFSFITADGQMALNQDVNLEISGGWSRAWYPRAFKLKGSKELSGNKNLYYPFFSEKPYLRNRTLQIRNGGNDTQCRFRDPALQYIIQTSGIDVDCQSYEPVHEFLNGMYIGVLNMREPNNKHYVYSNYGWDDDEIDQFEMSPDSGYVQKCGTPDAYDELVDVLAADAANSETYAEICRRLDIDAYINYMAAEFYISNWDWPQNNVKGFRNRGDGKFRFVLFDLDGAFNSGNAFSTFMRKEKYTFDQLYPRELGQITEDIRFVKLFKGLLKNEEFRRKFIDTFCIMGGSVFEATRACEIIDKLEARVTADMAIAKDSPSNTANSLRNHLSSHITTATNAIHSYGEFNLSGTDAQQVTLNSDAEGAQIYINDVKVPTGTFNGKLFKPVTLRAVAPAGYVFKGWKAPESRDYSSIKEEMKLPADNNVVLTACFRKMTAKEKAEQGLTPVRINEVCGSNGIYINEYNKKNDWIELYNTTDEEIDVEGMYLSNSDANPTLYRISKDKTGVVTTIAPHGYLIVWCDKLDTTAQGLHAPFKVTSAGGVLTLTAADNSWTDVFSYGKHEGNTTIGRYPDGCANTYVLTTPTIGKANLMTSYAVKNTGAPSAIAAAVAEGSLRICYGSQTLLVNSGTSGTVTVELFTTDGRLIEQQTVETARGTARVSVAHLPAGFYVARATDGQREQAACKFMK